MKLTNLKILPLIFAGTVLLGLSGCDKGSGTASDHALGGVPPVAVDDTGVGVSDQAATVLVVANDTDAENNLDVSSVQIVGTANPGDSLVAAGEGTWSVSETGSVTFTPEAGFTNDPSVIEYVVSDTGGLTSNTATVTIDYPQTAPVANDDDANGTSGLPTTVNILLNDTDAENDINTSSIHITGTANPGDSLVATGEGTWSISSNDRVVFTPEAAFTGDPASITYTVTDNTGLTSNAATVTVDYPQTAPVAVDDNETNTTLGEAVTLNVVENDTDAENDIDASTVHFVDVDATNTDSDDDNDHLIVAGEGNWTVDEDGNVTFSPDANFTGDPTPVFYTVTDNTGLESNEANITIDYPENFFVSCKAYLDANLSVGDGIYTIDPDGSGGLDPFEVYCDMTTDSGGWTLVVKQNAAVLAGGDAINVSGMINMEHGKLSDTMIAAIDYTTVKISSDETDINVYIDDTDKRFGWDKAGMGYNGVLRGQCAATEQSSCIWYDTSYRTIDLLYDGGMQGEACSRYWIDHDGTNEYEKSFRGGSACAGYAYLNAYVWVK